MLLCRCYGRCYRSPLLPTPSQSFSISSYRPSSLIPSSYRPIPPLLSPPFPINTLESAEFPTANARSPLLPTPSQPFSIPSYRPSSLIPSSYRPIPPLLSPPFPINTLESAEFPTANARSPLLPTPSQPFSIPSYRPSSLIPSSYRPIPPLLSPPFPINTLESAEFPTANARSPLLPTPSQPFSIPSYRPSSLIPSSYRPIPPLLSSPFPINTLESAEFPTANARSPLLPTPSQSFSIPSYRPSSLIPSSYRPIPPLLSPPFPINTLESAEFPTANARSPLLPTPSQPFSIPSYRPSSLIPSSYRPIPPLLSSPFPINTLESAEFPTANARSPLLPTPSQSFSIPSYRPSSLIPLARFARSGDFTGASHLRPQPFLNQVSYSRFLSPLLPTPYLFPSHLCNPPLLYNPSQVSSARNSSNLITIKPIKSSPRSHCHRLSFHLLNARNLRTKSSRFLEYVSDYHPDVVAVTETWFTSRDAAMRAECTPPGYKLLDRGRSAHRQGGGTALLCRDCFSLKCNSSGEVSSFEFSDWTLSSSGTSFRTIIIYRPPYSRNHPVSISVFLDQLSSFLEPILLCKEPLIISGDFNIHVDIPSESLQFSELLRSLSLIQHVNQPTHEKGHILDLIISRSSDDIILSEPAPVHLFSDHFSMSCSLTLSKPSLSSQEVTYRPKAINLPLFLDDLASTILSANPPDNLEDLLVSYSNTLSSLYDRHAPPRTKTIVTRRRVPWFTSSIKQAKQARRKAERKWRYSNDPDHLVEFKHQRNLATHLMNRERRSFYSDWISQSGHDQRSLFRKANSLLGIRQQQVLPPHADNAVLSQELANFFVLKVDNIRSTIDSTESPSSIPPSDNSTPRKQHPFHQFNELSEEEIVSLVSSAPNKSCGLDPIPTSLVKSSLPILSPILRKIVNKSLSTGYFPSPWKRAIILPKLKKANLDPIFSNYRPLSNLSFISKITERAASIQVVNHLASHNLFPRTQSAYRKHHSTETALLKVTNDILLNMNSQHVSLLVLLDLSSAFDTVDHTILLARLQSHFGICDSSLSWFESYLSGRTQFVSINGSNSSDIPVQHGVPQGSCLGPLLFTLYTSPIFDLIKSHLPSIHCYADDTQVYISFKPDSLSSENSAVSAIQSCISAIRSWLLANKLLINDTKTEFLIIGTRQQLSKIQIDSISVGESSISSSKEVRNLGAWLDNTLSMSTQVSKVASSCFYYIYNIRRIRKYLSSEVCETLINALVTSRLDYCNSLLYGSPSSLVARLQRVQNSAARLIHNISRTSPSSPLLINLHWLPVKFRIIFKILLITYKAIHSLAPEYIIQLIQVKTPNRTLRSSNTILLQHPSIKSSKTLGDRAFSLAAPAEWNILPPNIRNAPTLPLFKKLLKTHLFRIAHTTTT